MVSFHFLSRATYARNAYELESREGSSAIRRERMGDLWKGYVRIVGAVHGRSGSQSALIKPLIGPLHKI